MGMQPAAAGRLRHYGGFVLAGGLAFLTDAGVFTVLADGVGLHALLARALAIALAMVVSWLINRTVTFPVDQPATLVEFARFAVVAWSTAALNYAAFAGLILAFPELAKVLAIAIASLIGMDAAYLGMRHGVFRK